MIWSVSMLSPRTNALPVMTVCIVAYTSVFDAEALQYRRMNGRTQCRGQGRRAIAFGPLVARSALGRSTAAVAKPRPLAKCDCPGQGRGCLGVRDTSDDVRSRPLRTPVSPKPESLEQPHHVNRLPRPFPPVQLQTPALTLSVGETGILSCEFSPKASRTRCLGVTIAFAQHQWHVPTSRP